jgi:hypothetical protein
MSSTLTRDLELRFRLGEHFKKKIYQTNIIASIYRDNFRLLATNYILK